MQISPVNSSRIRIRWNLHLSDKKWTNSNLKFYVLTFSFVSILLLDLSFSPSSILFSIMIHVSVLYLVYHLKFRMLSQYSLSPNKFTRGCLPYVCRMFFLYFAYTCSKKRKYRTSCNAIRRSFWSGRQCRLMPAPFCILIWLCNSIALLDSSSWLLSCDAHIIVASSTSVSDT